MKKVLGVSYRHEESANLIVDSVGDRACSALYPFGLALLLGSAVLWIINTLAPLAPFSYSLF